MDVDLVNCHFSFRHSPGQSKYTQGEQTQLHISQKLFRAHGSGEARIRKKGSEHRNDLKGHRMTLIIAGCQFHKELTRIREDGETEPNLHAIEPDAEIRLCWKMQSIKDPPRNE